MGTDHVEWHGPHPLPNGTHADCRSSSPSTPHPRSTDMSPETRGVTSHCREPEIVTGPCGGQPARRPQLTRARGSPRPPTPREAPPRSLERPGREPRPPSVGLRAQLRRPCTWHREPRRRAGEQVRTGTEPQDGRGEGLGTPRGASSSPLATRSERPRASRTHGSPRPLAVR